MSDKQRLLYGARIRLGWFLEAERLGSVAAVCRSLGVPRRTYYYWHKRWLEGNKTLHSLCNQPRIPNNPAKVVDPDIAGLIVGLRIEKMYGEDVLAVILKRDYGIEISNHGVHNVLKRAELLTKHKKKVRKDRQLCDYLYYPGEVMQLDVKHWRHEDYQYDIIDCCTRIKFKYIFEDFNVNTTVKFLEMAIRFYEPAFRIELVQMDNGPEFTNENRNSPKQKIESRMSLPDKWLIAHGIEFRHIPPRSHHLNGRKNALMVWINGVTSI